MGSEDEKELEDRWWLGLRGVALRSIDAYEFTVALNVGERAALTVGDSADVRVSLWTVRSRG